MADKTVDFNNTLINASTIQDFYQRLNALGALDHGTGDQMMWVVPYSYPQTGETPVHDTIAEAYQAVMNTKSALSFLSSVDISTYTPTIPTADDSILKSNVAAIEWQIGQLENACYTNFTTNRTTVNGSNFSGVNIQSGSCSGFFQGYGGYSAFYSSRNSNYLSFSGYHGTYKSSFGINSTNRTSFNNANRTSFNTSNFSNYTTNSSNRSPFSTGFSSFNTSNFSSARYANKTSNNASNFSTNETDSTNRTSFSTSNSSHGGNSSFNSGFHSSYHGSYFSGNFNSYRGSYFGGYRTTYNSAQNTAFFSTNRSSNFDTNFTNNAATFFANHGTFTVTPL